MSEKIKTRAVAYAFPNEGATYVWAEAMRRMHQDFDHELGATVLHASMQRDGSIQQLNHNRSYRELMQAGIPIDTLGRHHNESGQLPIYTPHDLARLEKNIEGKGVVTTLEEYALDALDKVNSPPIIANLYRSGAGKSEPHIQSLLKGLESGKIVQATVDADASRDAYIARGVSPDSITVIHNGIDTDVFAPNPEKRAAIREELEIPADAATVLFIGRDSPEKDVPLLVRSIKEYRNINPDGHIIMAGAGLSMDNPEIARLVLEIFGDDKEIQEYLSKHVHLLGNRSDIPALYDAADVLALTSATESRPLCITEAQASGLGVAVSTEVGDAPSMIGKHGFITGRNPSEIADKWDEAYKKRNDIGFPIERRRELDTRQMTAKYDALVRKVAA